MLECVRFVFDCFCKAAPGTFTLEILRESEISLIPRNEVFSSGAAILETSLVENPFKIWHPFNKGITDLAIHSFLIASAAAFFWEPGSSAIDQRLFEATPLENNDIEDP